MTKVAVLGRGSPLTALPLLSSLLTHRQQQVAQAITTGPTRPMSCLPAQRPYWGVLFACLGSCLTACSCCQLLFDTTTLELDLVEPSF